MKPPDTTNLRTTLVVVLAVLLAGGLLFAAPALAAHDGPNINPDSVADEWDGDDTDTVSDFAAETNENSTVTYETVGDEIGEDDIEDIRLNVSYDGVDHVEYDLTDAEVTNEDTVDEGAHVEFTVEHDDLETLPGDADGETDANVTIWELDDDDDTVEGSVVEFEVTFEFAETHAVIFIDEADDVQDEERFFLLSDIFTAEFDEDIGVYNESTEVDIFIEDEDLQDAIDLATTPTDDGDRVGLLMATTVDGDIVYVFDGEPGEDIEGDDIETTGDAYIVIDSDDEATLHPSDTADEDELSVEFLANERPSYGDLRDLGYGILQAIGGAQGLSVPFFGSLLAVLTARTARRE